MCQTVEEARAHVLALLDRGYSPEDVEERLGQGNACVLGATGLTHPSNEEVFEDGTAD